MLLEALAQILSHLKDQHVRAAVLGGLDAAETQRAREACELIVRRGFHRGRDLGSLP